MKTGKKVRIILATILELINIAGIVLLTVFLSKLPVLPGLYLAVIYGVLLLLTAGSALLLFPKKKREFWYAVGAFLALLSVILTSVANYYLYHSISALGVVANQAEQKTVMGVYVRAEEDITSVEQCAGMSFGIIGQLERDRTNQALAMAEQDLGETIEPQEYSDVILLVNGLLFRDCDVILLNEGYLEPLKEVEGYEDLDTRIRQIGSYEIVTYVETPQEDQKTEEPKEEEPVEPVEPGDPFLVYVSGLDTCYHHKPFGCEHSGGRQSPDKADPDGFHSERLLCGAAHFKRSEGQADPCGNLWNRCVHGNSGNALWRGH